MPVATADDRWAHRADNLGGAPPWIQHGPRDRPRLLTPRRVAIVGPLTLAGKLVVYYVILFVALISLALASFGHIRAFTAVVRAPGADRAAA
jgi:hypothetical protein